MDKTLKADLDDTRESTEKCNKVIRDLENMMGEYESTIKDLNKAIEKNSKYNRI